MNVEFKASDSVVYQETVPNLLGRRARSTTSTEPWNIMYVTMRHIVSSVGVYDVNRKALEDVGRVS